MLALSIAMAAYAQLSATPPEFWPTTVFFDSNQSIPDRSAIGVLRNFVGEWHQAAPGCGVMVKGHSDARGFEQHGDRVSEARAEATADALAALGIPRAKIVVSWVGAAEPLIDNRGKAAQPQNRRVEVFWNGPCR